MLRCLCCRAGVVSNLSLQGARTLPMLPVFSIVPRRTMSSERKKQAVGGGNGGDTKSKNNMVLSGGGSVSAKYWLCYGVGDFAVESLSMKATSLEDVYKDVSEMYGMTPEDFKKDGHKIEVKTARSWKPLKSLTDLTGGDSKHGVPIRVPAFYEDESKPEQDYGNVGASLQGENRFPRDHVHPGGADVNQPSLEHIVGYILDDIKTKGFKPMSNLQFPEDGKTKLVLAGVVNPTETISTKQFILNLANENESVRDVVVNRIGAIHHLAEAVHFPFVDKLVEETDGCEALQTQAS